MDNLCYNTTLSRPVLALSSPADQVKGSEDFLKIYCRLKHGSEEKRLLDSGLDKLKLNMTLGEKTPRPQWPPYYVKKYGIDNLWKLNLSKGARLVYTLLSEKGRWIVVVLETFLTHKEYEKRFGYS